MIWIVGALALAAVLALLALQYAIGRNGPAVLSAVDRLTGGTRGTALVNIHQFGSHAAQKLLVYASSRSDGPPKPVIIFAHGGSWRSGDPEDYGFIARALVPEGFVVVLAGYRLGDDSIFPAIVQDTASVTAWTAANIERYGGNPDAIYLSGHSAGAYNVVMTALDRQWLDRARLGDNAVKGVIGLSGPYDFFPFDSDSTQRTFGSTADAATVTQPVAHVRRDAPPMLLMTGEKDTTVRPRNTRILAQKLAGVGASVQTRFFPDMDHISILTAIASPWRRDPAIVAAISNFVRQTENTRAAQMAAEISGPVQTVAP
ncbi:alpha/beta hydrolase [Pontixanthobacter sp.]|uniref:alpha/beta hydrolase n=1 Tax=Pontixanthobacter sp. TaxID=2792078 RepID=UPI003C7E980F